MRILITGGASGLGEAITRNMAANKENSLVITYSGSRNRAEELSLEFGNITPIKCDFSKEEEVNELVQRIPELDIEVLVNNAYCTPINQKHFHKVETEKFLNDFQINLIPTIQITQAVVKRMRKLKKGKVITILTSALVNVPPIGYSVYVANKAYLEALTKVWANENAKFNITSNSISPAFMQTNLTQEVDERIVEAMIDSHPQKQLMTTDEVAKTVSFLSTASNQMNGVNLVMNAGVNIK